MESAAAEPRNSSAAEPPPAPLFASAPPPATHPSVVAGSFAPLPAPDGDFRHVSMHEGPNAATHFLFTQMGRERLEAYEAYVSASSRELFAPFRFGAKMAGHPGVVHGGATAALFDDALGLLFFLTSGLGFTANLNVNFRRPLPTGKTAVVVARVEHTERRKVVVVGRIVDPDSPGDASRDFADARGLFVLAHEPASH